MRPQDFLQKIWQHGLVWETKAKLKVPTVEDILNTPVDAFIIRDMPFTKMLQPSVKKDSQTYKGARHLEKYGSITGRDVSPWANSPTDVIHHLRKAGFIKAHGYDTWETGQSGKRYKRYWWTGKTLEGKK